MTHNPEIILIC